MSAEDFSGVDEVTTEPDPPARAGLRGPARRWRVGLARRGASGGDRAAHPAHPVCSPRARRGRALAEAGRAQTRRRRLRGRKHQQGRAHRHAAPARWPSKRPRAAPSSRAAGASTWLWRSAPTWSWCPTSSETTRPQPSCSSRAKGLTMEVAGRYSDTIPAGAIISQNPPAGTEVRVGSQVVVVVSLGILPETRRGSGTSSSGGSTALRTAAAVRAQLRSTLHGELPGAWCGRAAATSTSASHPAARSRRLTSGSAWDTNPLLAPNAKYVVFMRAPSKRRKPERDRTRVPDRLRRGDPRSAQSRDRTPPRRVYYGTPVFAPSPTGTAPGSDWLVTPQYMTEGRDHELSARLLVTNVPDRFDLGLMEHLRSADARSEALALDEAGVRQGDADRRHRASQLQRLHGHVLQAVARCPATARVSAARGPRRPADGPTPCSARLRAPRASSAG